ncbi:hypothetical protein [Dietzia natronolimnaea]|uniref:hypothetical protein n=1 Tax=Dietzia natronolimnaea TaxID=161920 RepID=UPI0015F9D807|nr:hypothetical protein [Dietzia natronolimnaea]MBB1037935.1 hypothetical protein [Dietzia natronolimnaea]
MPSEDTTYETTELKAIRGTESKAIARKQQEGWELVNQQKGRLHTTMIFRRPKPKTPWKLWAALGAVGVVLASIITAGALLEEDSATSGAEDLAASTAEQPSSPAPTLECEAEPSPSADPMICETSPGGEPCRFGQTAIYSDEVRAGEVRLEISVGEPVKFTPSDEAWVLYDRPLQPVSVYLPVTVKNTSPALALQSWIHSQATNAQQGEYDGIQSVSDGDIESVAFGEIDGLPVGESVSVKDGWNMATLEGIEYRLSIDGLAGYDIKFTR